MSFFLLTPLYNKSKKKFRPFFQKSADLLIVASELLIDFLQAVDNVERRTIYKKIKDLEFECDAVTLQILEALNKTKVSAFHKADIRMVAEQMDDVMDYINSSAKRVILYQPKDLSDKSIAIAKTIKQGCELMQHAIDGVVCQPIKQDATFRVDCEGMKKCQKEADAIYEQFIVEYFKEGVSPIEIIKQSNIMKELEMTTNCVNNVGKSLKSVLIRQGRL